MSERKYKRYTKEFKTEAVRLAEQSDKPVTQLARELGVRVNQIYKWKKELAGKAADAFPGSGRQSGKDAELTQLKREVERLRQENEILKKAAVSSISRRNGCHELTRWRFESQGFSGPLIETQRDPV